MGTDKIRRIHMIGICGTAMATLGAMLKDSGYTVTGSDEGMYPPMSDFLAEKGIDARKGYNAANLCPTPDLVVIGNALSRGNPEIEYTLDSRIPFMSLPETLKTFFLRRKTPIVVTGTHGKTTTASMISWSMVSAGLQPDFLIGGIAENFHSGYGLRKAPAGCLCGIGRDTREAQKPGFIPKYAEIAVAGHLGEFDDSHARAITQCSLNGNEYFVLEGDEYDSAFFDKGPKFLHYLPYAAVVGSVEFDHADIYSDLDAVKLQFRRFVNLIPRNGFLAVGADSPAAVEVCENSLCRRETFGLEADCVWTAQNIRQNAAGCDFDIVYNGKQFLHVSMKTFGEYNVRNALGATAVLNHIGVAPEAVKKGLETFAGVRRRLQLRANVGGIRIYEDFAHHPTAVRETLKAVRAAFHPQRIWAIYEPRSATSRRNIFQKEIAEALGHADCVAISALFRPGKVREAERLDEDRLIEDLRALGRAAWNPGTVDGIIEKVCGEARAGDLIVIMSNGGFGGIYEKLPASLAISGR